MLRFSNVDLCENEAIEVRGAQATIGLRTDAKSRRSTGYAEVVQKRARESLLIWPQTMDVFELTIETDDEDSISVNVLIRDLSKKDGKWRLRHRLVKQTAISRLVEKQSKPELLVE